MKNSLIAQALTVENSLLLSRERAAAIDQLVESAVALPNYIYTSIYTSAAFAARERDALFADTWLCIGFGSDVPAPGDLQPVQLLELPLVVVRSPDGAVNVFHNVCSHRGQLLVQGKCTARHVICCPYRSWIYSFNGEPQGMPHFGGPGVNQCAGFDRAAWLVQGAFSAVA